MKKNILSVIIPIFFIGVNLNAACCTCAEEYADMATRLVLLEKSVGVATEIQSKESEELKKAAIRNGMVLAFEKKRAEAIAQVKAIDSAGFALSVSRHKAEKSVTTAERMRMILKGYDLSDKDVGEILKTVEK